MTDYALEIRNLEETIIQELEPNIARGIIKGACVSATRKFGMGTDETLRRSRQEYIFNYLQSNYDFAKEHQFFRV